MRLLIISHTPHYRDADKIFGWGPTVREIDQLARLFNDVVHVAPLYESAVPNSSLAYAAPNVQLRFVQPAGGERWRDKLSVVLCLPKYLWAIWWQLRKADVVHVRCPANISLLAVILLSLVSKPRLRWIKYAGNWMPTSREAWSYSLQRWWLKHGPHRGVVTVNGEWTDQPSHVRSFYNPSLTDEEATAAHFSADEKTLTSPVRLLFVGRLEQAKGVDRALRTAARLLEHDVQFTFDLVGDGPERSTFERTSAKLGLANRVRFHGWLPRPELAPLYARAHLFLFPSSCSEGWPKVLSEAMAYGVVPIAGNISCVPQYLSRFSCGSVVDPGDVDAIVKAIETYVHDPNYWWRDSQHAVESANNFTYSHHLAAVASLLGLPSP